MADPDRPTGTSSHGPVDPRLLRAAPALRPAIACFVVLSALSSVATVVEAASIASAVAAVVTRHTGVRGITGYLWALAGAMALKALAAGASEWIGQSSSLRVQATLRQHLLGAAARTGARNLSRDDRSRIAAASTSGLESLDGYVSRAIPAIVSAVVAPPILLAAIGFTNWLALLLLLVTLPLVPVFMAVVGVTTKRHMDRRWAQLARLSGQFLDVLEGLTSLRVYGKSRGQIEAIRAGTDRLRRHTMATLRVAFVSGLVLDLLATLSVALVAVTIGLRLDAGKVGLAAALTVLILAPEVFAPIRAVGAQHHATQEARAVLDSVFDLMARSPAQPAPPIPSESFALRPDRDGVVARLRGIGVSYPDRAEAALAAANLDVTAPALTVLTGPSGAGKSTVLSVLAGQIEPDAGEVLVGSDRRPRPGGGRWFGTVAWLPQRPRLTCENVAAETLMGDPGLGDRELERILRLCEAPAGGTALGEDGQAISAGQRRRVALARAVARAEGVARDGGVPLVLLDEPTEDLDAGTASAVRAVIQYLASWAAVVVATHDREVVDLADYEFGVAGGRVHASRSVRRTASAPRSAPTAGTPATPASGPPAGDILRGPAPVPGPPTGRTLGLLARWVWQSLMEAPHARRSLAYAGGLGSLAGISGLALTATSVWLICRAAQHPNVQALAVAVVGVRTFAISKALLRYGERLAAHDGALRLLAALRVRIFAALEPLAPAGLGKYRRGDLLRRFTADVDGAQDALVRAAVPMAGAAATALTAVLVGAILAPRSAAVLLAGLIAAGVLVPASTRIAAGRSSVAAAAAGRRDWLANGALDALEELTAYGRMEDRLDRVAAADLAARVAARRPIRAAAAGTAAGGLVSAVTMAAVLAAGTATVTAGALPAVELGVLVALVLAAFDAVAVLPAGFAALTRCAAGLGRVEEVLERPAPVAEQLVPVKGPAVVNALAAHGLRLAPAPGTPDVVVDGELRVAAGERVAIVGPSGAGKSTLLTAALGLLSPSSGRIEVSDDDTSSAVTDMSPETRSHLVAGSLQGDHVFATTIRDNLRVVAPTASDADLDRVARRVGLHQFVSSLPDGWSTQAGPDGAHLSGGQRQRLLLARALLAKPEVLVLDEPTAHLDGHTEAAVMADLMDSTTGMTVLMSTHRRVPLEGCDRVVNLTGGRLEPALCPAVL